MGTHYQWMAENFSDEEMAHVARERTGDLNHIKRFKYECPYCEHEWTQKNPEHGELRKISQEEINATRERLRGLILESPSMKDVRQIECPKCKKPFTFFAYMGWCESINEYVEGYTKIRQYSESACVFITRDEDEKRLVITAGGYQGNDVDLLDVLDWVKENKPELLEDKK